MKGVALPGALVVSLDFELAYGVPDRLVNEPGYATQLRTARDAIPRMLELFQEYRIHATWAVVGALFASSRDELERYRPTETADYTDPRLRIAAESIGRNQEDDPLHFAPDLVDAIRRTPGQEIASHTFSHFYCGERGQGPAAFRADVQAACSIANSRGIRLRSIVFPRNQHNPAYDPILTECGFTAYRGNPRSFTWEFTDTRTSRSIGKRVARWLDDYVDLTGPATTPWADVLRSNDLSDVRASRFLRLPPRSLDGIWFRRMRQCLRHAAERGEIFHVWWHPHNFGSNPDQSIEGLRRVFHVVEEHREIDGMLSLSMSQVDDIVRGRDSPTVDGFGCVSGAISES